MHGLSVRVCVCEMARVVFASDTVCLRTLSSTRRHVCVVVEPMTKRLAQSEYSVSTRKPQSGVVATRVGDPSEMAYSIVAWLRSPRPPRATHKSGVAFVEVLS